MNYQGILKLDERTFDNPAYIDTYKFYRMSIILIKILQPIPHAALLENNEGHFLRLVFFHLPLIFLFVLAHDSLKNHIS